MQHKSAYLVILCSLLMHMNVIGSDVVLYHTVIRNSTLSFLVSQSMAYLLYPLLGWLADVYFTRYKFVKFSFITIIMASITLILVGSLFLKFPYELIIYSLGGLSLFVGLIGIGLFESTAIQFGMDQMLEASSDQLSTFIHWYYWSCNLVQPVILYVLVGILIYFSQCTIKLNIQDMGDIIQYLAPYEDTIMCTIVLFMGGLQLVCACAGLCLLVRSKRHFYIDRTGQHPLKLIYRVLRYAWNHTCPEKRSAFTYWENDIPPRIDLGKNKYGGPFTTEEVEDTKTFLRIILLLLSLLGFHLSGHGYSLLDQLMRKQCPSFYYGVLVGEPMHITILIVIIGVPVYQWINVHCCQRYLPNMLKRMGLGLLCCLIKEVINIILQATMTGSHCEHIGINRFVSCYFLISEIEINGTCSNITDLTDNQFFCDENDTPFFLLLISSVLQGLSFLLVFMTALEFICAQAPLRLKGLLIGLWYASLAVNYLLVGVAEAFITESNSWEIFNEVKAFLIFLSLMFYLFVSKSYHYRKRDEVVNEQYLVEEIYERNLDLEEEYERQNGVERRDLLGTLKTENVKEYGSTKK